MPAAAPAPSTPIPATPRPDPAGSLDSGTTDAPAASTGWRARLKCTLVDNAGRAWCPYWLVTAAFRLFRLKAE